MVSGYQGKLYQGCDFGAVHRSGTLRRNVHLNETLPRRMWGAVLGSALLGLSGCAGEDTDTIVRLSDLGPAEGLSSVEGSSGGLLQFPESAEDWADSPQLLSETGAFTQLA